MIDSLRNLTFRGKALHREARAVAMQLDNSAANTHIFLCVLLISFEIDCL